MKEISANKVAEKLNHQEDLNLIDVREEEEVAQGMIPSAEHIPLGEVSDHLDELDPSKEYIMICRSGGRSGKAQKLLIDQGFDAVNMTGGMLAWDGKTEPK